MARAAKTRRPSQRTLLVGGAVLAALVLLLYLRSHRAGAALEPGTGQPRPDQSGAQQPSGGAASVPGNLPGIIVSQPDQVQQQVQQTPGDGGGQAPTSISPTQIIYPNLIHPNEQPPQWVGPPSPFTPPPPYVNPPSPFTPPSPIIYPNYISPTAPSPAIVDTGNVTGHGFV